jgi:bacteriocin-like protein
MSNQEAPKPTDEKPAETLEEKQLEEISGGLNPQPLPPGRFHLTN